MNIIKNIFNYPNQNTNVPAPTVTLNLESFKSNDITSLDNYIKEKNLSISSKAQNYNEYLSEIDDLINKPLKFQSELEYRYYKYCQEKNFDYNANKNLTDIEKMKILGKIGNFSTKIIQKFERSVITNNSLKVEGIKGFVGVRSTTCVSKGKWAYECQVLTSGLMQIGFCQFHTKFERERGVGDDETSYAFDGYRLKTWHKEQKDYGKMWDIGDIIGVTIDLNEGNKIEYYLNGEKLGEAFNNVTTGPNVAYFAGASMSKEEKMSFNFGIKEFKYKYNGFEPFDIPLSSVNGKKEILSNLINFIKTKLLFALNDKTLNNYQKILLSYKIFYYLYKECFNDEYLLHSVIFNYLSELSEKSIELFKIFIELLIGTIPTKNLRVEFVKYLFDNLSNSIEENGLIINSNNLAIYNKLFKLFMNFLDVDKVVTLWFEANTCTETFKNIFISNFFRMGPIYEYLNKKYNNMSDSNVSVSQVISEINETFFNKKNMEEKYLKLNENFSANNTNLIYKLLTDKRTFFENKTLKDKFNELIRNGYGIMHVNDIFNIMGFYQTFKGEQPFYKNIYYNIINVFNTKFLNTPFEKIGTIQYFNRLNNNEIFYDDVGIGGTISHVTTEYINKIPEELKVNNVDFCSDFFHKIIKMGNDIFINPILEKYEKNRSKFKNTPLNFLKVTDNGSSNFESTIRRHFYLFSYHTQIIFFQISFYIIKFLTYLKDKNKYLIYFIPTNVVEFPFALFKTLYKLKSKIIFDSSYQQKINNTSIHFKNNDYIICMLKFYLYLFQDETIANPEIREKLLNKINFFIKKNYFITYFEKDEQLFDNLIKGLLNDIKGDSLSNQACKILLKIIYPFCFTIKENESNNSNNKSIKEKIKKYFSGDFKVFKDFIINYNKYLNSVMTEYIINLNNTTEKLKTNLTLTTDEKIGLCQGLYINYNNLCDLLKINEFFLVVFKNEYLNLNSLSYINLCNILKNLTCRILEKYFFENLKYISEILNASYQYSQFKSKKKINLFAILFTSIGILLRMNDLKNEKNYKEFILKMANNSEINFKIFLNYHDFLFKNIKKDSLLKKIEIFEKFIKEILSLKTKKEFTDNEIDKLREKNKICILCYENLANIELIPCKHSACEDCMKQYILTNDICFICHKKIEGQKKIEIVVDENDFK